MEWGKGGVAQVLYSSRTRAIEQGRMLHPEAKNTIKIEKKQDNHDNSFTEIREKTERQINKKHYIPRLIWSWWGGVGGESELPVCAF